MIEVGQILAGCVDLGLQRPQVEGVGNRDAAVHSCPGAAHGECQDVGAVDPDIPQGLAGDGQRERLAVGLTFALEACPRAAVPTLTCGQLTGELELPCLVRVIQVRTLEAEATHQRQLRRRVRSRPAAGRAEAPVRPGRGVADQVDIGIFYFQQRQHDCAAQQGQQLELKLESAHARQVTVPDPVGVCDRDPIDDGMRMEREKLQLKVLLEAHRAAEFRGERASDRTAQLVRLPIEHREDQDEERQHRGQRDSDPFPDS